MKSFKYFITENENPFTLGRILTITTAEDTFDALVVRSELPTGAILLVLTKSHPDCGSLINSKNIDDILNIHTINQNRVPITTYFFQQSSPAAIKRIEYHDKSKNVKEDVETEDVERSALVYFQTKYRNLKRKDATNDKLNLICEMLLTDYDDFRNRFIS